MGKSQETFNKKEREKKRQKKKRDKAEKRAQRKMHKNAAAEAGILKEDNFMYVDEDGNLTSTPPDPTKRRKIKADDIVLGVPKKEDMPEEDPNRTGTVKFFNSEKGYGFITDAISKDSIFVHANNLTEEITEGNKVAFEVEPGPKGPVAVKVKIVKD